MKILPTGKDARFYYQVILAGVSFSVFKLLRESNPVIADVFGLLSILGFVIYLIARFIKRLLHKQSPNIPPLHSNRFTVTKKMLLVFLTLSVVSFGFYWYEVRLAKIRHDCSWVKRHTDTVPARPVMTAEELKSKGIIDSCEGGLKFYGEFAEHNLAFRNDCEAKNKKLIEEYKLPKPTEPEKDWQVKATKNEYEFCLHDRGL